MIEEFFEEKVSPLLYDFEGSALLGYIGRVDKQVHNDLLVFELLEIVFLALLVHGLALSDPLHECICALHIMVLDHLLHLSQLGVVVRHISCQYQTDNSLSEMHLLLSAQLVNELVLVLSEDPIHF